jgi:D-serine deaminase-like pyridoxal phosphate-dependent protein
MPVKKKYCFAFAILSMQLSLLGVAAHASEFTALKGYWLCQEEYGSVSYFYQFEQGTLTILSPDRSLSLPTGQQTENRISHPEPTCRRWRSG